MPLNVVAPILLAAIGLAGCAPIAPFEGSGRGGQPNDQAPAARTAVDPRDVCATFGTAQRVTYVRAYVERLQALLATVRAREAAGEASTTDVAQVALRLADGQARLARAQADLAVARSKLRAATGRRVSCPASP
jgi:hypothetical protein